MGVDATAVARVVGIETAYLNLRGGAAVLLPQQVALIGQGTAGSYPVTPTRITSAAAAGTTFGFGSPIHLASRELFPVNGDGLGVVPCTVYALAHPGGGSQAAGTITPAGGPHVGTASYRVNVAGVLSAPFVVNDGDDATALAARILAAVNAVLDMPVTASDAGAGVVALDVDWEGESGNDVKVAVEGPTAGGITWAVLQPTGGTVEPDVTGALDQIVDKWETLIVNCQASGSTVALDAYQAWGEARWGALIKKPATVWTGEYEKVVATLETLGNGRKTDRVNGLVVSPADANAPANMPLQIAAAGVARMARTANNNPPTDYAGQSMPGLTPGAPADLPAYVDRDLLIAAGISSSLVIDGRVELSDTVTFYHPDGEDPPAYRYAVDIAKLQNVIFNLDLIFASDSWKGAPLIRDEDPTTNPNARKPSAAIAAINSALDGLGLGAILVNVEAAKKTTTAVVDPGNPKRLNCATTVQISGNTNVTSVDLFFGFLFGQAPVL